MNTNKIIELRKIIDSIDQEIVEILIKRHQVADTIINIKKQKDQDIFDRSREKEILNSLVSKYKQELSREEIESILKLILRFSKLKHNSLQFKEDIKSVRDVICIKPFVIAGPCTVESEEQMAKTVSELDNIGIKILRGGTFKPRTSPGSFQGLGDEGVKLLKKYADKYQMFTVTEFLDYEQLEKYYDYTDIIQIGSRNMMNFSLLKKAGKISAKDRKPIILKRGYGSTIHEFLEAGKYLTEYGNENVILALRGIRTFEQIDSIMRNTPDLGAILELKEKSDLNIIFDPSHSTGESRFVLDISKAALTLGADGLMIEVHHNPKNAIVDGNQSITPMQLRELITFIKQDL